jgi:hypothetical protein
MTANDRVDFPTIDLCIKNAMVWRKKEGSPDCNLSGQPRKRESVRHSRGQLSYRFGKKDSSNNSKSTSQPRATNRKKNLRRVPPSAKVAHQDWLKVMNVAPHLESHPPRLRRFDDKTASRSRPPGCLQSRDLSSRTFIGPIETLALTT